MKIIIHNLLNGKEETFEGDRYTVFRDIAAEYPWHAEHLAPTQLEALLSNIDAQMMLAVEVVDDKEHPLAV